VTGRRHVKVGSPAAYLLLDSQVGALLFATIGGWSTPQQFDVSRLSADCIALQADLLRACFGNHSGQ